MTANVSSPYAGDTAPARHGGMRVVIGVLGVAAFAVGMVLLVNPVAAAKTLALLLAGSFVLGGLLEIAVGWDTPHGRWAAVLLGAVLILGGVIVLAWPGVTVAAIALVTGLSLIVHGAVRVGLAVVGRRELPGWGWYVLAGAVNVLIGVVAIAWPEATVRVLCLVLGLQVAAFGVLLLAAAFVRTGPPRAAAVG